MLNLKKSLTTLFQGLIMGTSASVPGVDSSTLALVMGIYDNFINFLHSVAVFVTTFIKMLIGKKSKKEFIEDFKKLDVKFGVFLFGGMLIANFTLSNLIPYLLENHLNYTLAFFFGLTLASVSVPFREMNKNLKNYLIIVVTAVSFFLLLSLRPASFDSAPSLIVFFISGLLGVGGLILPGFSGAFVLIMLGTYEYLITVIRDLTRLTIVPEEFVRFIVFNLGLFVGFLGLIKILKWAFEKYTSQVLAILIGIMLGSLRVIYPFFNSIDEERLYASPLNNFENFNNIIGIAIILLGFVIVYVLNKTKTVDTEQVENIIEDNE